MLSSRLPFILSVVVTLLIPELAAAGTLDDAPFRVVVPNDKWQIEDATAQPMGKDVFLAATISHPDTQLKSVVIRAGLKKMTDSSLDNLCAGIRDSLANPVVKDLSETDTTFLGFKAKTFTYQVSQGGQVTYNESVVFVAAGNGWTITSVGRPDQKEQIKKVFGIYQKKEG